MESSTWARANSRSTTPPPPSATVTGPLDPHDFYLPAYAPPSAAGLDDMVTTSGGESGATSHPNYDYARPALHETPRSVSGPAGDYSHSLGSVRSHPVLLPSRPPGTVKDMANRFDRGAASGDGRSPLSVATNRERYTRAPLKSPITSASSTDGRPSTSNTTKLQKKRPGSSKSPKKSLSTSFDTANSFSSTGTALTTRSQPHAAFSRRRSRSPGKQTQYVGSRPLFGEITADGKWNGNFDLGSYGPLPTFEKAPRRGSEGSLALVHGRSQSHQDISTPLLSPPFKQPLTHKRSRSDMGAIQPQLMPSMPNLNSRSIPTLYPTPPDSGHRGTRLRTTPPSSRIPVRNGGRPTDSPPSTANSRANSRPASAMSNPAGRRRLSKSPTRPTKGKENAAPSSRSRYIPPSISTSHASKTLSARIVAPLPQTSPPLRSSRPRQPVSSATTSASRARAAERYRSQYPGPRDGRRPSEQWLGAPYDPQKERSRRKIPELDKIDFEERRARIQQAISQSLKSNESYEELRSSRSQSRSVSTSSRPRSRIVSREQTAVHTTNGKSNNSDLQDRASHPDVERSLDSSEPAETNGHSRGLSLETTGLLEVPGAEREPLTGMSDRTMFEDDESPVFGRAAAVPEMPETPGPTTAAAAPEEHQEPATLLTAATYQAPSKPTALPVPIDSAKERTDQALSILDHVIQLRERSTSPASREGTEFADDSPTAQESPDELDGQWGLGNAQGTDQGSIRIMLDNDPNISQPEPWSRAVEHFEHVPSKNDVVAQSQDYNQQAFASNGYMESPNDDLEEFAHDAADITPRKPAGRDDTLRPTAFQSEFTFAEGDGSLLTDGRISRVLEYYQSTGSLTTDMLEEMQHHMVDLHRISANGGSDANMIQSLLECIQYSRPVEHLTGQKPTLQADTYEMPSVTPDTPPMPAEYGHVIVYGSDAPEGEDEDFEAKIRKADEDWERQQRGEDPFVGEEDDQRPVPPPKDFGYTPRSSIGPNSVISPPANNENGLRISTFGQLDMAAIQAAGDRASRSTSPLLSAVPPQPSHEPPAPPPKIPFTLPDSAYAAPYAERESSEVSPTMVKAWAPSTSSRPSLDSQRVPPTLPGSHSMNSFTDSTQRTSFDTSGESSKMTKSASPGPEQKRLLRRRHIIKELLDTENSYHQDLKIIEDIYKATCTPDLVQPEDKKVLFGNCDEVERFALHFYDELRKAATQIYVPAKQQRWMNKRGSFSTTQSDGTTQTSALDTLDDEKDRTSTIGKSFLDNMSRMEQVYGSYLKNHDAANQRLSAIQGTTTVKCWLDECHANASDITAAWDLDSLLVKPTQRVAKYPMLLQQLLDTTPVGHPDHENLKSAVKDSITMLTRINDAKRRADLVDQVINGRGRKDSDIRSGLAKAFGRRTEKLKERVGIAEAFQDTEFDEHAHKFGGNYIRLQICMRDVQDYINRTEKATELVNNYANALELFTDVAPSTLPEIESKWRKYGQVIRDLTQIAFQEHKAAVQKRVLEPMLLCIKLHDGPQNAMNKRKKRILDYAKCKSEERRGMKPDKKTVEASDLYLALNDQLKIELPKLYGLTAQLVINCLNCFLDAQIQWQSTWERKLRPLLEVADVPTSIQQIETAFNPDFSEIKKRCATLSICNGTLVQEAANFLSPQTTLVDPSSEASSRRRRPSTVDSSSRTLSVGSESSNAVNSRRHSGIYTPGSDVVPPFLHESRIRSNSSLSARARASAAQNTGSITSAHRPWSNASTPHTSFTGNRPSTANQPPGSAQAAHFPRATSDHQRSPRPTSDATYFAARPDLPETHRFSGLFTSALPPDMASVLQQPAEPAPRAAPNDMKVLFVCASLFEFSIEQTRKEGGYPYLQYVQGEIFDVVGQKGELWLAKNQDDPSSTLGWIWEQHFIIVGQDES